MGSFGWEIFWKKADMTDGATLGSSDSNRFVNSFGFSEKENAAQSLTVEVLPLLSDNYNVETNDIIRLKINNKTKGLFRITSFDKSDAKEKTFSLKAVGFLNELKRKHFYLRGEKDSKYAEDLIITSLLPVSGEMGDLANFVYESGKTFENKDFQKNRLRETWVLNGTTVFGILQKMSEEFNERFFLDYSDYDAKNKEIKIVLEPRLPKPQTLGDLTWVGENNYFQYGRNINSLKLQKKTKDFANKIILNWGEKEYPRTIIEQDIASIDSVGLYECYETKKFDNGDIALRYAHRLLEKKMQDLYSGEVDIIFDDKIDSRYFCSVSDSRLGLYEQVFKIQGFSLKYSSGGLKYNISIDNGIPTIGEIFAKKILKDKEEGEEFQILDIPIFLRDSIKIGLQSFSSKNFPDEDFQDGKRIGRFDIDDYSTDEAKVYYYTGVGV